MKKMACTIGILLSLSANAARIETSSEWRQSGENFRAQLVKKEKNRRQSQEYNHLYWRWYVLSNYYCITYL